MKLHMVPELNSGSQKKGYNQIARQVPYSTWGRAACHFEPRRGHFVAEPARRRWYSLPAVLGRPVRTLLLRGVLAVLGEGGVSCISQHTPPASIGGQARLRRRAPLFLEGSRASHEVAPSGHGILLSPRLIRMTLDLRRWTI